MAEDDGQLGAILNLARYHRAHERLYVREPLVRAIELRSRPMEL